MMKLQKKCFSAQNVCPVEIYHTFKSVAFYLSVVNCVCAMGNVIVTSNLSNNNRHKPNPKLQQMDRLLSHYYELKGMIYYNDGIGKFSEWCFDNEYDIDAISKQLKKLPEHCKLTEFDPNFPTSNNIDCNDRKNEIYQVIRYCWHLPNKFYMNVILNKESITNTYILGSIIQKQQLILNGYFKQEYHLIPNDIINICGLYFIINKQSLCINIKPTWWKPKSVRYDIALCQLAYDFVKNNEYFIAYQTISMIINNYDYHNHSSQTKARLHFYRGLVSTQWNSLTHAENDMKLAAELHSNCYYIHHYAKILLKNGKHKEALKHCLHAIKLDITNVRSHAWCGSIYRVMNNFDSALNHFLKCIELEPTKVKYIFSCADTYRKLNDYHNTKKYCAQAIHLDPTNSDHHFQAAQILEHFKDYNDADKYYSDAITLSSKTKHRNKIRFYYGLFLKSQQKYTDALYQFNTTGDSKCLIECARLHEKLKDYDKATDCYLKAIQISDTPKPGYICYYADFLQCQHKYEEALQQYWIAMRLTKDSNDKQVPAVFWVAQGDCYVGLGDFTNATRYYLKAIDANPRYKLQYAKLLYLQGQYNDALNECLQMTDLDDFNEELVTIWIAHCYKKLKDYNNATTYYLKAISLDETDGEYCIAYAMHLCKNVNDLETAKGYFLKAIELDLEDVNLRYCYAVFLRDYYRDYQEAEVYYQKCLELGETRCN
eukprot:22634_1